jgi:hypothetical protein
LFVCLFSMNHQTEELGVMASSSFGQSVFLEVFQQSFLVLYVQVTVHRANLRINKQQDASSIQNFIFSLFRTSSVPIIRSYQLYTWQLVCFMQVMWPLEPDCPRQGPHNLPCVPFGLQNMFCYDEYWCCETYECGGVIRRDSK